jgi:CRP/FNR family cyclic AMP-dependent transcriptional regulator
MNARPNPDVVARSPLGAELDADECRILAEVMTTRRLRDAEALIEEGHVDNTLHVIDRGVLKVTRTTGTGAAVTLHLLEQHDIAGELGFLDGLPHSATLRALGEAQIVSLQREAFESLIQPHPALVYKVMRAIVRTVHGILLRMNLQYVELTNYITKQHGRY